MGQWLTKALREGKRVSSWSDPNVAVEEGAAQWLRAAGWSAVAAGAGGAGDLRGAHRAGGRLQRLGTAVPAALPSGVPDLYQGGEGWDLSLVDPDNRRAVDYPARQAWLRDARAWPALLEDWRDGGIKAFLLRRLLDCRRRHRSCSCTARCSRCRRRCAHRGWRSRAGIRRRCCWWSCGVVRPPPCLAKPACAARRRQRCDAAWGADRPHAQRP